MNNAKLMNIANAHFVLALSQKTEMPLCVMGLTPKHTQSKKERIFLSLGARDHEGNIWMAPGKFSTREAMESEIVNGAVENFFSANPVLAGLYERDIFYVSIQEFKEMTKYSSKGAPSLNDWQQILNTYEKEHSPPSYVGLSSVHEKFSLYLQGDCIYYALALGDLRNEETYFLYAGQKFLHAFVKYDDEFIEDIWGRRRLENIIKEFSFASEDEVKNLDLRMELSENVMAQYSKEHEKIIKVNVEMAKGCIVQNPLNVF